MDRAIKSLESAIERLDVAAEYCREDLARSKREVANGEAALAEHDARRAEYLAAIERLKG